ncbi:MFS general substrate transporter [Wilcoxina mikolae CBS 423.85]|nr:MFS general substrate transporter [Wilcoxina mikolae CBS 423.85]
MDGQLRIPSEVNSRDDLALSLNGAEDPFNWSNKRKWLLSVALCVFSFAVSMGSTVFTPAVRTIAADFEQNTVVAILGLSFYVLGFALGPVIFAPLSEVYGRRAVLIPTWALFCIFQIGCATAPNIETLLICRLLVGTFGSPCLTVAGGVNTDFWRANELGPPLGLFTMSAFMGPVAGPIIGGFCVQELSAEQGWRWCFWVQLILSSVLSANWVRYPETFQPILIERKRKKLRFETKENPHPSAPKMELFGDAIWRPLQMLFGDPIVFLASLYISFLFGVLYLFFAAYPIVFQGRYHMKAGYSGLAFLGIGCGVILSFLSAGYANKIYIQLKTKRGLENSTFPEGKLPPAMLATFFIPISLFWFAWSGFQRIHWIVPILSGILFGWGFTTIFISLVSFVAEGYLEYSSSAIAATTILRSLFAASFPLFSMRMYNKLSPEWASSLLAGKFKTKVAYLMSAMELEPRNL